MINDFFSFQILWTFDSIIVLFPQIFNVSTLVIFSKGDLSKFDYKTTMKI